MKRSKASKVSFLLVLALLLTLFTNTAAVAQKTDPDQGAIAIVTVKANEVSWQPQVESAGFVLTISGPGDFYLQREYRSDDRLTFSPEDSVGDPLPDGSYTYELLLLPVGTPTVSDDAQRGLVPGGTEPLVLSGNVSISGGRFVTQDATERASSATEPEPMTPLAPSIPTDQLIYDDLIVTGSVCIGFDCVNGESFGFDTLRLKENNLRIKFQDTSSSASFPTNDWQITANDSANGGANKFSIDDIDHGRTPFTIEANAPNHSLYVEDYGRVGLGTSTPVVELHIKDSDTPTTRLEQDGSGGWTPQTWDLAGNEANFFIRDVTNGSKLPFRIQPGAPSDSLSIKNNGDVGIGTWSPDTRLHVEGNGNALLKVEDVSSAAASRMLLHLVNEGPVYARMTNSNSGEAWLLGTSSSDDMAVWKPGSVSKQMQLDSSGNLAILGTLSQGSDVNAKDGFAAVDGRDILAALVELPITSWNFKSDGPEVRHLGPMAQDFYKAFGLGKDELHIAPLDAASVALVAIQSLDAAMAEKDAQIHALQEQNAELQARLIAVEQALGLHPVPKTAFSIILPWLLCAILLLGVVGMISRRRYSARG